jgi:hypothetical protein
MKVEVENYLTFIQKLLPKSVIFKNNLIECKNKNGFEKLNEKIFNIVVSKKKLVVYFKEMKNKTESEDDMIIVKKKKASNKVSNKFKLNKFSQNYREFIQQKLKNTQELNEAETDERAKAHYEDFENYYKKLLREM